MSCVRFTTEADSLVCTILPDEQSASLGFTSAWCRIARMLVDVGICKQLPSFWKPLWINLVRNCMHAYWRQQLQAIASFMISSPHQLDADSQACVLRQSFACYGQVYDKPPHISLMQTCKLAGWHWHLHAIARFAISLPAWTWRHTCVFTPAFARYCQAYDKPLHINLIQTHTLAYWRQHLQAIARSMISLSGSTKYRLTHLHIDGSVCKQLPGLWKASPHQSDTDSNTWILTQPFAQNCQVYDEPPRINLIQTHTLAYWRQRLHAIARFMISLPASTWGCTGGNVGRDSFFLLFYYRFLLYLIFVLGAFWHPFIFHGGINWRLTIHNSPEKRLVHLLSSKY